MFRAGHIQDVYLKIAHNSVVITASCLPEMRKNRLYNITIKLEAISADIQFASCGCVAGKGPKASCKQIAALCYALEDFVTTFRDDAKAEALSRTDKLMEWNKLSPKRWSERDFSVKRKEPRKKAFNLQGLLNKSDDKITQ